MNTCKLAENQALRRWMGIASLVGILMVAGCRRGEPTTELADDGAVWEGSTGGCGGGSRRGTRRYDSHGDRPGGRHRSPDGRGDGRGDGPKGRCGADDVWPGGGLAGKRLLAVGRPLDPHRFALPD